MSYRTGWDDTQDSCAGKYESLTLESLACCLSKLKTLSTVVAMLLTIDATPSCAYFIGFIVAAGVEREESSASPPGDSGQIRPQLFVPVFPSRVRILADCEIRLKVLSINPLFIIHFTNICIICSTHYCMQSICTRICINKYE